MRPSLRRSSMQVYLILIPVSLGMGLVGLRAAEPASREALEKQDLAVSSGSACTSANPEPSHVLRALGLSEDLTRASLRFGLGRFNTEEDVDFAIAKVAESVRRLRKLSSMNE